MCTRHESTSERADPIGLRAYCDRDLFGFYGPDLRCRARWRPVSFYLFLPLTTVLNVAPAVNLGAFDALIFTGCPVCGLRPVRAPRFTTENFPNPVNATSSPFLGSPVELGVNHR